MRIDLSLELNKELMEKCFEMSNGKYDKIGHFGTHFDSKGKTFPLDYCERNGVIFDVTHIQDRDIECSDINLDLVSEGDFILIRSGMIDREEYGSYVYSKEHTQLSHELINKLIEKKVSLIGIDMAGVRRGVEHAPADQLCADHGTFIIENIVNMDKVIEQANKGKKFVVHTYPINLVGYTGIPSRVIAEFE